MPYDPAPLRPNLPPAEGGEPVCRIAEWKPHSGRDSLLGNTAVAFRNGLIIPGVPIFRADDGGLSVGVPTAPMVDCDGVQLRDTAGKRRYANVIACATVCNARSPPRWNRVITAALRDADIDGGGR
jgi:hypothetical protein